MANGWGKPSIRVAILFVVVTGLCCGAAGAVAADTAMYQSTEGQQFGPESGQQENASISQQSTAGDVQVSITASPAVSTYPSDGTIVSVVGVLNASEAPARPMAGEDVTVTVEAPDGSVVEFNETTGTDGSVRVPYDLESRPDGTYTLSVEHDNTSTSTSISVQAGISLAATTQGESVYVDKETTLAFLARNGEASVAGETVTMEVSRDGQVVASRTAETDTDGFVNISFVPGAVGQYQVTATAQNATTGPVSLSVSGTELSAKTVSFVGSSVRKGEPAAYAARVVSADGPVANTDLTVEFDSFGTDQTITAQARTDDNGLFFAEYEIPAGSDFGTTQVTITTADGRNVVPQNDFIFASGPPGTDDGGVDLSVSSGQFRVAPGGTSTHVVEATNGSDPIANQEVDVVFRYGQGEGAPVYSEAVTTNGSGQATVTLQVPSDALDGARISLRAAMEYEGATYTDANSGPEVRYLDIDEVGLFTSGEASVEVTDRVTGDPVSGVPVQFDAQYSEVESGSFHTETLTTDATGQDVASYGVPADVGFVHENNFVHRYRSARFPFTVRPDYPGDVVPNTTTAAPNETVELALQNTGGATAGGIVFGETSSPEIPFAANISTGTNATVRVPQNASEGARFDVIVWAVDGNGNLYQDFAFEALTIEVTDGTTADYANESGVVDNDGLRTALDDWRQGDISTQLLRDVVDAWRTGEQVA